MKSVFCLQHNLRMLPTHNLRTALPPRRAILSCALFAIVALAALLPRPLFADLENCLDATCRVSVAAGAGRSLGTGCVFAVSPAAGPPEKLFVLTNAHVAGRVGTRAACEFWHRGYGSREIPGVVVWSVMHAAAYHDLAIIELDARRLAPFVPRPIPLGSPADAAREGQTIVSAGCPLGRWPSLWKGHAFSRAGPVVHFKPAPENGRSGSALFDAAGTKIIGLIAWNSGGYQDPRDYGIAMHAGEIRRAMAGGRASADYADFADAERTGDSEQEEDLVPVVTARRHAPGISGRAPASSPRTECQPWGPFRRIPPRPYGPLPGPAPDQQDPGEDPGDHNPPADAWPGLPDDEPPDSEGPDLSEYAKAKDLDARTLEIHERLDAAAQAQTQRAKNFEKSLKTRLAEHARETISTAKEHALSVVLSKVSNNLSFDAGKLLAASLGVGGLPALAIAGGAWFLGRRIQKQFRGTKSPREPGNSAPPYRRRLPQRSRRGPPFVERAPPEPTIAEDAPAPNYTPTPKRNREFVEVDRPSKRLKALERAMDEFCRRNPGAVPTIQTIEAYADQYESGDRS